MEKHVSMARNAISGFIDAWDHLKKHKIVIRGKKNRKIRFIVWVAVVWVIWGNRNRVVFRGGLPNVEQMLTHVKGLIWGWTTNRLGDQSLIEFEEWIANSSSCLNLLH